MEIGKGGGGKGGGGRGREKERLDALLQLSTLCYAHAASRQPEQLPDYIHMYAHIGRLAILHISTRTFICT
jgi:hypothetical protein